ncbi:MAG: Rieske 2Fe-2S domain-containing protein [Actinomycetota bacterium]|nr:Rieske 2Fe-2S domain-containing protein [Actinomycetota bacterium]
MAGVVILRTADAVVARRAEVIATAAGLTTVLDSAASLPGPPDLVGLLVELDLDDSLEAIRDARSADPDCTIVAFLALPEPELWRRAEAAGADAVTTRGRVDRVLAETLADRLSGRRRARRVRLAPLAEFAGRLGHVGRIEDTPAGPIALYHLGGTLYAVADTCPHAGASLCEGELEGAVVTCPWHGSQFRVTDGARLRGPADFGLTTFPVVIEAGDAFLEMPA